MRRGDHQVKALGAEVEHEVIRQPGSYCDRHKDEQVKLYCTAEFRSKAEDVKKKVLATGDIVKRSDCFDDYHSHSQLTIKVREEAVFGFGGGSHLEDQRTRIDSSSHFTG